MQNRDAFEIFEPLVDAGEMVIHTAGSLRNGERIWALCQLNQDNSEIVTGDEIAKFVLLSNGHDGKLAVHFGFTPIRVVCANTEALARGSIVIWLPRVSIAQTLKNTSRLLWVLRRKLTTMFLHVLKTSARKWLSCLKAVRERKLLGYVEPIGERTTLSQSI